MREVQRSDFGELGGSWCRLGGQTLPGSLLPGLVGLRWRGGTGTGTEVRLCMKEPQVGVLCPEIRELDGDFGDELGWSFFPVGHDARMYH